MTLITNKAANTAIPTVHALVIGVSRYPHLQGGGKKLMTPDGGLGQLESPVTSAEHFCKWLQTQMRPQNMSVGSIEVLCSTGGTFADDTGQRVHVSPPTLPNVRRAVADWVKRGDSHPDNFMLMYFCGHGVSSGIIHSLLLQDFGKDPNDPFDTGAIDIGGLMDGVRSKSARTQLFLIDACRTVGHADFAHFGDKRGASIISAQAHGQLGTVEQACLWATSLGSSAYGQAGQPSLFMSALLHGMKGGGALQDPADGTWQIQPDGLKRAIDHIIQRRPQFAGTNLQLTQLTGLSRGIAIHSLPGEPSVPIRVQCVPEERNGVTRFTCSSGDTRGKDIEPWHLDLQSGPYKFKAKGPDGTRELSKLAAPPYSIVSFNY